MNTHIRLQSLLLLSILLLVVSTFSVSSGFPQRPHLRGRTVEAEYGVVSLEIRSVLEENNAGENNHMALATSRTHRKDPLDGLNHYKGGWNIGDKHYLSSVLFTGAPLFFIAAVWLLGFGLFLFAVCLHHCCCLRQPYGYSEIVYALSLISLVFFTVAAIVGCIVLFAGQGAFYSSTKDTLDYVVWQADNTAMNLTTISSYLDEAKNIRVDQYSLLAEVQNNINKVQKKINNAASTLNEKTAENSREIRRALNIVRVALIVLSSVMLLLAFAGFLLSIFGMQCLVYTFVIIGWILVTITFILSGVFLVLHNVTEDTCVAMDEWVRHPMAHTALDDILPCVDNATAQETLAQSQNVTIQLVSFVNTLINVSNADLQPGFPLYHNQSGPPVPFLCNPFNPDRTNRNCTANEVNFTNAAQEWMNYVCQVSDNSSVCITEGRLIPKYYNAMTAAANVSYALYQYSPFLVGLGDCSFVRKTFSDINADHCPDLKSKSKLIYIGLVMVSAAVMLSLISWVFYTRERRHRVYHRQFIAISDQHSIESQQKRDAERQS
ncbi:hypothetical protein HS088_TW12G00251 [Tripterygium wilfordii]|uniref:Transmembrane protein n=1 Tax=Tripterygium wilfordii TaxID=458696 RepID=A0A7J7CY99_TRIWF|nr:uncharacterized protein LOC120011331 [Tripterygium wilfordii]KAF5739053.1 hypothetical protein HS088_TW12G00251 [Tripterygium wilfordii]